MSGEHLFTSGAICVRDGTVVVPMPARVRSFRRVTHDLVGLNGRLICSR